MEYKILSNCIPVKKYWECGDGCCSEWVSDEVDFEIGSIIEIDDEDYGGFFSHETYQAGHGDDETEASFYEYRCAMSIKEYIELGYIEIVEKIKG